MTVAGLPRETARRTLFRAVILPSWGVLSFVTLLFAVGFRLPSVLEYAPFVLSFVLFGLPHGAVDHLVPDWLSGREATVRSIVGVALLYFVLASLYLTLWFVVPEASFALLIALTWFHWGAGDLYSLKVLLDGDHLKGAASSALTVLVRGSLPMLVPLLAFPEVYREVAQSVTGLFVANTASLSWVFGSVFRLLVGAVLVVLSLTSFALDHRRSGEGGRVCLWSDVAETALLAAYFSFVPPVFAIGLYFCFWHALRHVARLVLLDTHSAAALERGRAGRAFAAFFRDAAPLTLAALAILCALYFVVPGRIDGAIGLLALYLVLISILTLPHVVIVALMDYRQRVWR